MVPLLPALGLVVFDTLLVRRTAANRAEDELRHVVHLAATFHNRRLDDTRRFLARLAHDPAVRDSDDVSCHAVLARTVVSHDEYPNVAIVDLDGTITCSALPMAPTTRLSAQDQADVVVRAIRTAQFAIGDFTIGPISGRPVILTGYPIAEGDGSRHRALLVSVDAGWLGDFATNAILPRDATMAVIDRHGRIVSRFPNAPRFVGMSVRDNPLYPEIVRRGGNGVATGLGVDSVPRLYVFARIRDRDDGGVQFVIAGLPVTSLFDAADRSLARNLLLLLVVFAISVAIAWWLGSASVVAPVHRILDATKRIARGDLSARAAVEQMDGEMATLAAAFDHMASSLEQRSRADEAASAAHRRESDYVRHIIDVTPALVCGIQSDGTTTFVNRAVESTTGYSARELIGRNWWTTFYPGESAQIERFFAELENGPVRDHEMDLMTASGEIKTVSWNSFNKTDADGKVVEVIGFGMDTTERTRAERDRDRFEIQLRQAQKLEAIGELAAGIAHEINTPTQYIGDNMRFLSESFGTLEQVTQIFRGLTSAETDADAIPLLHDARVRMDTATLDYVLDEIPRAITQSLEGVERVSRIVRAMKDFSHPGADGRMLLDVNRAIETTLTVATNEWKYVAEVVLDLDPTLPAVTGHAGELNQVFLNLVVNAAHAIAEASDDGRLGKGLITLSTRRVGSSAEVRVSDTGTGIPEAIQARVFDPFFTTKAVGKGTGQGLAICHAVVERHHGTIAFETEVGDGTTFIVTLPFAVECPKAMGRVA
jgi:PAS domain S-box-containing protein